MATHSTILAWKIPRAKEPAGLPFTGSPRTGHDWAHARVTNRTLQKRVTPEARSLSGTAASTLVSHTAYCGASLCGIRTLRKPHAKVNIWVPGWPFHKVTWVSLQWLPTCQPNEWMTPEADPLALLSICCSWRQKISKIHIFFHLTVIRNRNSSEPPPWVTSKWAILVRFFPIIFNHGTTSVKVQTSRISKLKDWVIRFKQKAVYPLPVSAL